MDFEKEIERLKIQLELLRALKDYVDSNPLLTIEALREVLKEELSKELAKKVADYINSF